MVAVSTRLDAHSFEWVCQKTSLSTDDFYNHPEKITDVYCAEMVDMFTSSITIRAAKDNSDGNGSNTSVTQYRLKVNEFADSDKGVHAQLPVRRILFSN